MAIRAAGQIRASVRLDAYYVDDQDPTEDPESFLVRKTELPVEVTPDAGWATATLDVSAALAPSTELETNTVMLYLQLEPPAEGEATLDIDDLALIEWRPAGEMPDRFGAFTHVRNDGGVARTVEIEVLRGR
jgi:hypothetical protein